MEAFAADALLSLVEHGNGDGASSASGPKAMIQVLIDHTALTRGYLVPGERSEIAGVGPISVASAKSLMSDSILSAVVLNGIDVTAVNHLGRTIPAHLRTALVARDETCVVPGCDVRWPLQIDHIVGVRDKAHAYGKPLSSVPLAPLPEDSSRLLARGQRSAGGSRE